jgi:hypothetical protein
MEVAKEVLLCLGDRRTPTEIPSSRSTVAIERAARALFEDAVSSKPLLQIWRSVWDSWVDLREADNVPDIAKVLIVPQLEDQDINEVMCLSL